jgi:adenylosuccinate synthase
MARYAQRINGATDFALTKLDNYDGLDEIPVCVAYDVNGVRHDEMPISQSDFHHAAPIYETLPGWKEDITGARTFEDLPKDAQRFVEFVEARIGARISIVGVGPGREAVIERHSVLSEA